MSLTGFTDTMASPFEVYTITPLNNGLVNGGIFTDAPAGNATKAAKARRIKCSKRSL
jgi:hypothetical protein